MQVVVKFLMVALATGAGIAAVTVLGAESVDFEVSGHKFEVPKDHLFRMTIPWLPKPEKDSFTFLFEPTLILIAFPSIGSWLSPSVDIALLIPIPKLGRC